MGARPWDAFELRHPESAPVRPGDASAHPHHSDQPANSGAPIGEQVRILVRPLDRPRHRTTVQPDRHDENLIRRELARAVQRIADLRLKAVARAGTTGEDRDPGSGSRRKRGNRRAGRLLSRRRAGLSIRAAIASQGLHRVCEGRSRNRRATVHGPVQAIRGLPETAGPVVWQSPVFASCLESSRRPGGNRLKNSYERIQPVEIRQLKRWQFF